MHLVGILKETAKNRYVDAHERATDALVAAARATRLQRIVYLSILGSDPRRGMRRWHRRGARNRRCSTAGTPAVILRVPMVLGEDDYAAHALSRKARAGTVFLLRGASLEQPIYAGDVVDAIVAALEVAGPGTRHDRISPDPSRCRATARSTRRCSARPARTLRVAAAGAVARHRMDRATLVMENPPITAAMLGVLDHDDCIDPAPAAAKLGIRLTRLDEMLRRCVRGDANHAGHTRRGSSA